MAKVIIQNERPNFKRIYKVRRIMKEKEVTIYDLAEKLNISIATVSRALKNDPVVSKKTRKKIEDLAEQLGYRSNHFASYLRKPRTYTIGVIVPKLNSYFMSTVIAGIESVANQAGYNLIISQSSESTKKEQACARTMFNNRVDGLLVSLSYDTDDISHFDLFFNRAIPLIFFDRVSENEHCTNVLIDNRKAAYEITSHLIGQGCRRIAHITAQSRNTVYADRLAGYKQALQDKRIAFKNDYVLVTDLSQKAGGEAAKQIMQMKPLPDAVFVANDNCAVCCMLALKKAGIKIPEQIAFAGFNNDPVSTVVEPNLTTINYPGYEMGEVAARHLINHLNGTSPIHTTNTILLRSELVVRASSEKKKTVTT